MPKTSDNLPPVLALDGPSGSGKGTVGQMCAARLGWHYLDSGAIYRGLAWAAREAGVAQEDTKSLVRIADHLELVCHLRTGQTALI